MPYISTFAKYADFSGRAKRSELWPFILINYGLAIVLLLLGIQVGWGFFVLGPVLARDITPISISAVSSQLFGLLIIIPSLAVQVRRLHDTGRSGWWVLFAQCVPFVGCIVFVFLLMPSNPGPNQYGPEPS